MENIDIKKRLGFKKGLGDIRDFKFAPLHAPEMLPPHVDLTNLCPPVVDQGELGSCTANAIGSAYEFVMMKQKEKAFAPSRLFIYYNERVMEGTVKSDAGAEIRDGFKSIANQGVCRETCWKYDIAKFAKKPTKACYTQAAHYKAVTYMSVTPSVNNLKGCLADGFPFVFGISVYESFEATTSNGIVPMPDPREQLLGGHAIMAVGYDDVTRRFKIRNSWGEGWGDKGYFYLPYEYLMDANLSSDFWTVRVVS